MHAQYTLFKTLYRLRADLFVCGTIFFALFYMSCYPTFFIVLFSNGEATASEPLKLLAYTPITFMLYFLGFLGLYFWTRVDHKHWQLLFLIGVNLVFGSWFALQVLWNMGNS